MIRFYLEAIPMMNGQIVELRTFTGDQRNHGPALGAVTFQRAEWEAFRPLLVAGIKNSRVPTQLLDQTRREAPKTKH